MNMELLAAAAVVIMAFLMIAAWRIGGRYGKIKPDQEVTAAYESFSVRPDRHYYISGPDACPVAVIGIVQSSTLKTDFWRKQELDSPRMKALVQNMQRKAMERGRTLHGFNILDPHGEAIGDCYSALGVGMTVKKEVDGTVVISTPPMHTDLP